MSVREKLLAMAAAFVLTACDMPRPPAETKRQVQTADMGSRRPASSVLTRKGSQRAEQRSEADVEPLDSVDRVVAALAQCPNDAPDVACSEAIELRVIAHSAGRVVRDGGRICIRPETARTVCVADNHSDTDEYVSYTYLGQFTSPRVHVLQVGYYEGLGVLLVDAITGKQNHVSRLPVPSPDGRRLAVASMDMAAAFDPNEFVIYRYDDGALVQELKVSPNDWGPGRPRWPTAARVELPVETDGDKIGRYRVTGKRIYDLDGQGRWRETVTVSSSSQMVN